MAEVKHDDVTKMLSVQVEKGIEKIVEGNKIFLAEETGTPQKEIDKILKDSDKQKELPKDIIATWLEAEKAYKVYREQADKARNAYRVKILKEEAKDSSVDTNEEYKQELKDVRSVVMEALSLIKTYAKGNKMNDVVTWAESFSVPQVGRQGTSSVGAKKPRVYVKVDEVVYDSFTLAAAAISKGRDKEEKIQAGDLTTAWNEIGEGQYDEDFEYGDYIINVTPKEGK